MHATPRYPAPLKPGSRIAVPAPSSGAESPMHARLDLALAHLRARGFVVEEGRSLRRQQHDASAPAAERAAELMALLQRDDVDAIVPPWGGELAIELLDRLDWAALAHARPKWLLGYSDTSTWLLPITLRLGWATAHGPCLMDLVPGQDDALTAGLWPSLALPAGAEFEQRQSRAWQRDWIDFRSRPDCTYSLTETTHWRGLNRDGSVPVRIQGRLVGGCLDTLLALAGGPFADIPGFIRRCGGDGCILYLENAELSPTAVVRALHALRWAGWFDGLAGLVLGRSSAPEPKPGTDGYEHLGYEGALRATLADQAFPVLFDADIGHLPPQMLLINGARATLDWQAEHGAILAQRLD